MCWSLSVADPLDRLVGGPWRHAIPMILFRKFLATHTAKIAIAQTTVTFHTISAWKLHSKSHTADS